MIDFKQQNAGTWGSSRELTEFESLITVIADISCFLLPNTHALWALGLLTLVKDILTLFTTPVKPDTATSFTDRSRPQAHNVSAPYHFVVTEKNSAAISLC